METRADFARLKQALVISLAPFYGTAVVCIDDANVREILRPSRTGWDIRIAEDAQIRAFDTRADGRG